MELSQIWTRIRGRYQRAASRIFFRRPMHLRRSVPYISFTFDDSPRSALYAGGDILGRHGHRATYYVSLGLMGKEAPTGMILTPDDLKELLARGHEVGCHTFAHCHSWDTAPEVFDASVVKNQRALDELFPGKIFRSLSYPLAGPRPGIKRIMARHFECCRGGGQTFNEGEVDLNFMKSFFLEHSRNRPGSVKEMIDKNSIARGWLIFTTHDIDEAPTRYGCTPSSFEEVVEHASNSGAKILPVAEALDEIRADLASELQTAR